MIGKALLISTAAVGIIWTLAQFAADTASVSGKVRVIDGDTIEFYQPQQWFGPAYSASGPIVRLAGIDAPESGQLCHKTAQDCGMAATVHLMYLISTQRVTCRLRMLADSYQRRVGDCTVADQRESLNALMVADGYAVDYPHYSHARFAPDERLARARQRGLWAYGGFEAPWLWRAKHKDDNAVAWGRVPESR